MTENMPDKITLLPYPQSLTLTGGTLSLSDNLLIALDAGDRAAPLYFMAKRAQQALKQYAGINWDIVGGTSVPLEQIGLTITVDNGGDHPEGYRLTIAATGITITAHDPAGAFYAVVTLIQLLQQYGGALPAMVIRDHPDMPHRGVMLDISRDKVPTMETLFALIDKLASWKVNQFQLYTEHTFAYRKHPEVWAKASPITAEESLAIDAYCRERYIDFVPNQNSFGHMHRWFEVERYHPLAEAMEGFITPWGEQRDHPYSLDPQHPGSLELMDDLYDELLPNFTSQYFNVGLDETFDLGQGRSKDIVEQQGKGRVYLDFLLKIYERVKARRRTMQFWGDIIGHYPELVKELPRDTVALEWGYESDHPFDRQCGYFAASGIPFYVCPGTSSWTTISGRTKNAMGNIRSAVENGLKHGATGILNTDWGDLGHWQTYPVSYLGFAYGAALGWSYKHNVDIDIPTALNVFAFEDKAGVMGKLAYDLGNAYLQPEFDMHNGSILFWAYQYPLNFLQAELDAFGQARRQQLTDALHLTETLQDTLVYIDEVMAPLDKARMQAPDATLITPEFELAGMMLRHGARRLLYMLDNRIGDKAALYNDITEIESAYRTQWLKRNRPGGLEDSMKAFAKMREEYR